MDGSSVLLVLCRRILAGLLVESIRKRTGMEAYELVEFDRAKDMSMLYKPKLALVEVPERNGSPTLDALTVCKEIKEASPGCKVILICPENDEDSVKASLNAIRGGEIDDFLFYDLSVDYLVAKIESLLPA